MPNSLRSVAAIAGADARDARDVVDRVAGQGQEVDDLVGPDAPVLLQGRGVHLLLVAEVEQPDMIADQLAGVLVGRDDEDVQPPLVAAAGQGGDHVVGLHLGHHQHGHPEPLEHAADHRDLRDQVGGHLGPVRLVLGVDLRAEDRPVAVEGGRQVVGLAVRAPG